MDRQIFDAEHDTFREAAGWRTSGTTWCCVVEPQLDAATAAMAKWRCTELQKRVVDQCLQMHGGYGYMSEYPISRAYLDSRIQTIYGGTTEIMKELIGRSLGF